MPVIAQSCIMALFGLAISMTDDEELSLGSPSLGVNVVTLTDTVDVFKKAGVKAPPTKTGVVLLEVAPYGPADAASLRQMDVITRIDKIAVTTEDEFKTIVAKMEIGKECEVTGFRGMEVRGRLTWKRGTVKLKPVTLRDVYLNAMDETKDDITGESSFRHKDSPKALDSASELFCYYTKKEGADPVLIMQILYVADEWLDIEKFTVKTDERVFNLNATGIGDIERDTSGAKWLEWNRRVVGNAERPLLESIANSEHVTLRCYGSKYQKDRDLSEAEIERVKCVLTAFRIVSDK